MECKENFYEKGENKMGIKKKLLSLTLIACMLLTNMSVIMPKHAEAASTTKDHGFTIDENLYDVTWFENKKVNVYQTVSSWDSSFDKDVYLGYANVNVGFATTYKSVDGKIYQRVLVEAKMVPQPVNENKNKYGMSQYLTIKVKNGDEMKNLSIQPASSSGSTTYSTTGSFSGGENLDVSYNKSKKELTLGGGGQFTMGISSTNSYTQGALIVTSNIDSGGFGRWDYDYKAATGNGTQNAYLFGSSTQRGLYMWNMKDASILMNTLDVKVTATFGGGNKSNNTIVQAYKTKAYNLGSATKSFTIQSYDSTTNYAGK